MFFRTVLDLQKNWVKRKYRKVREFTNHPPPHTHSLPCYLHLTLVWYICSNYWTDSNTLLTKIHRLFRSPKFLPNVLFLFGDLICNPVLHLIVVSPIKLLLAVTVSQICLVFENPWWLWEVLYILSYVYFKISLYWNLSDIFLMIRLELQVLARKTTK